MPGPVQISLRADGTAYVRPSGTLPPYPARLTDRLEHWARLAPDRPFVAQRNAGGEWQRVTYADALRRVRHIASALLERGLSSERPVAILSGNGIEHLLLGLACMYIGVPYAPVSASYATLAGDHAKLRHVLQLLTPGLIATFPASDREAQLFRQAIANAVPPETPLLSRRSFDLPHPQLLWDSICTSPATGAVDIAHQAVDADTIAKFLLTSGSTGQPKAVVTTQRMLCSNQQMIATRLPFLAETPPVLVDWLPWNHVFGGSHNVGIALYNGGTLYIDDGRPVPGAIERTVRNLREISPTIYFNVPKGFEALVPHLEGDAALRTSFYRNLQATFFAGAGLSQAVWDRLDAVAQRATGRRVPMISGLGTTETAPFATCTTSGVPRAGDIGLPVTGNELKLAPVEGKLELRIKGPNVTPGYWRQPALSRDCFDEEGYYRLGDAARFLDPARPEDGLLFDGRIAEDFKLATGTWVSVGPLRSSLLTALAPFVQDVVIAGLNRDFLAALIVLDVQACRSGTPGCDNRTGLAQLANNESLRATLAERLVSHARAHPASSTRIARAVVLDEPPSLAIGEITDKGSINQRTVLATRAALVEALFAESPPPAVIDVVRVNAL